MLFEIFSGIHRLHRHEGYIFPEGLLGGSREPFWESFASPWGVQRCSWEPLGALLASLGGLLRDVFGERPGCVFLYLVAIAGIFCLDILAYPGEIVFFDNIRS